MNDFLQQLLEHELGNRHFELRHDTRYQERQESIIDRLIVLEGDMSDSVGLACFCHGFCLAGRLLMELLP